MAVSTIAVFIIPSLQMASTDCHLPFFFSSASCDLCTNILLGNNGYPWYFPGCRVRECYEAHLEQPDVRTILN